MSDHIEVITLDSTNLTMSLSVPFLSSGSESEVEELDTCDSFINDDTDSTLSESDFGRKLKDDSADERRDKFLFEQELAGLKDNVFQLDGFIQQNKDVQLLDSTLRKKNWRHRNKSTRLRGDFKSCL